MTESDVPSPTSLVFSALTGGEVQFFAATAGREAAIPLSFDLGVEALAAPVPPSPPVVAQLVPLNESSLSLVGTLLIMSIQTPENQSVLEPSDSVASTVAVLPTGPVSSPGQSLPGQGGSSASEDEGSPAQADTENKSTESDTNPAAPASVADGIWKRYLLGIDDGPESEHPRVRAVPLLETGHGPSALFVPGRYGSPIPRVTIAFSPFPRRRGCRPGSPRDHGR